MRPQNLQTGPGTEQISRARSGTDGVKQQNAALAELAAELMQAVSAFKLEAYAAAQMQRAA